MRRVLMSAVACAWLVTPVAPAFAQADLTARVDAIIDAPIAAGTIAGASVAVVKGGQTLLSKAYGKADLELDVPTPPGATYEIGSVTKQFTAAIILLLQEEGTLALDDEITKFLPDYPTQGHRVTLRRLLNHTSGIRGYTEMREFGDFSKLKRPREELMRLFAAQPFDFPPGEEQIYNNSAFFLLGLVIEKVTGQPYETVVQQRLFDRVGMSSSYYCSEKTIRKNHVHGYDTEAGHLVLKGYIDHAWPYAAGSLCSNTTDLVAWNRALHGGKVLRPDSYAQMIAPGALSDGTPIRYGLGIAVATIGGRPAIAHGGGINGFLSESEFYPQDDLIIVVLVNTAGPVQPRDLARKIADAVLPPPVSQARPFAGDRAAFTGVFTGRGRGRASEVTIGDSGSALTFTSAPGNSPVPMTSRGGDTFAAGDTLLMFERRDGRVVRLRVDSGTGHNILTRK